MKSYVFILFGLLIVFSSCKQEPLPAPETTFEGKQVLILNEGNFSWGNSSVALYSPEKKEINHALFEKANDRPLGDVLQSGKIINGRIWLVVNNSGKIEIIDTNSFKSVKTITGLRSPRFISELNGLVYVTDLYADKLTVFDATTFELKSTISESGWTEKTLADDQWVYFINKDSNTLNGFNPVSKLLRRISILGIPFDLVRKNDEIHIASYSGDSLILKNVGSVSQQIFAHALNSVPGGMLFCKTNGLWYFKMGNNLRRINAAGTSDMIYQLKSGSLYAANIIGDEIYLSNAKDYVQNSEMIRLDLDGKVLDKRESGRITNGFLWLE